MAKHMTGTRKEWLAARLELLEAEKELTRRSDELARRRQELPWVRIGKEYRDRRGMGPRDGDPHARGVPHVPGGGARAGKIITISSGAYASGRVGAAHYCASKAGVVIFTRVLPMELAEPSGEPLSVELRKTLTDAMCAEFFYRSRNYHNDKAASKELGFGDTVIGGRAPRSRSSARRRTERRSPWPTRVLLKVVDEGIDLGCIADG